MAGLDDYTRETRQWLDEEFESFGDACYNDYFDLDRFEREHAEHYFYNLVHLAHIRREPLGTFLDVGGAEGAFAHRVTQECGSRSYNAEISHSALVKGRRLFGVSGAVSDMHVLPWRDGAVDLVFSSNALEHVTRPREALEEMWRIAGRGIMVITPGRWTDSSRDLFCDPAPDTPHRHLHFFSPDDYREMLPGLDLEFRGVGFLPFYFLTVLVSGRPVSERQRRKYSMGKLAAYRLLRWIAPLTGAWTIRLAVGLDPWMSRIFRNWTTHVMVIARRSPRRSPGGARP